MHSSSEKMQSGGGDLNHLSSCQQKCYFSIIQLIRMKAFNNCALWKIWSDNQMNLLCKVRTDLSTWEYLTFISAPILLFDLSYQVVLSLGHVSFLCAAEILEAPPLCIWRSQSGTSKRKYYVWEPQKLLYRVSRVTTMIALQVPL